MSQPDYADLCEHYAGMGLSGSDAAAYAGSGIVPEIDFEEEETADEEETEE